ncbi:TonB-dependent receptor [Mucilaginibacter aquatilis]|uniref:TonB-dependent receptor n=1 Tax=Mucilaginibacter aquatilis TaxID=1517760 RepID=UPI001E4E38DE|nr:TonB-dependent receptor [Mucilaginibacter aquatilis]
MKKQTAFCCGRYVQSVYCLLCATAILFILLVLATTNVSAQQNVIKGRVSSHHGHPLSGVVVSLAGYGTQAMTDSTGSFKLPVSQQVNYTVTASHVGYKTQSKTVSYTGGSKSVTFILHPLNHELEEVHIQDNRALNRKQSESMNVEVVGKDFIQRNLGGSLMTTLSRLPGVKTIGIGSGQSKPLIRGLGFNRVVVTDKGIKHEGQQWGADHGLELDQFAASEVEILKGAASFIYGSDAIAGVIDVKPSLPPMPGTFGGSVDLIGKTNNSLYGTSVNVYGRKKNWFFDSRLTYQNYGDYKVPTDTVYVYDFKARLPNRYLRNTAGRESGLHFNTGYIGEHFRSTIYLSNVYSRSGFFANAHGLEPRQVDTLLHDQSRRDIQMPYQEVNHFKLINRSQYHTGKHLLQADIGYQRNFRQEFSIYVNHGFMPPIYPTTLNIPQNLEREFDKQVYSINARDVLQLNRHQLTFGFNAEHQDNQINGWSFLVPAFKQTTSGIFIYDKFALSETVLLHGALRYDYGRLQTFHYSDWFPSEGEFVTRANAFTRSFNSIVWSAGINYTPEGNFSLKANLGKSFRMPIAKELAANGVNYHYFSYEQGNQGLNAEQSYQADVTLGWNTNKWQIQLSPFYNYFPNYIYLNPTGRHDILYGAGNQVFNYSQSRVMRYGGELQVKYRVNNWLSAEALGEYLYAEQLSGEKKGFTLPFSPPPSLLLNVTYQPVQIKALKDAYLSVDYRLTAAQNNTVPPERETQGYRVMNIQAGTKVNFYNRPLMLSLQVQNVFDTRYLNHTSFYRLIQLPEAGRNIILSAKIPFGR